ncbi:MAG: PAS domain-containing protein, partial [Planctomycetaceae bacterium]
MTPDQFLVFANPLPEPMFLISGGGTILACNRAVEERTGIPRQDFCQRQLAEMVAGGEAEVGRYLKSCMRNRNLVPGSLELLLSTGGPIACRAEGAVLRPRTADDDGILLLRILPKQSAVGQFVALNQRIADLGKEVHRRKQAEQLAREEEERLRVTLHSIGDAVVVTDPDGFVVAMNPIAQQLTGWSSDEAAGQPLESVFKIVN